MKNKNQTGLKNFKRKINLNHNVYIITHPTLLIHIYLLKVLARCESLYVSGLLL